jgi:hypothetical protein
MTDRPIIFSAPMVRALLDGRKTQTRRILSPRNTLRDGRPWNDSKHAPWAEHDWNDAVVDPGPSPAGNAGPYLKAAFPTEGTRHRIYPIWAPSDRMWVREAWSHDGLDIETVRSRYEDALGGGIGYGPYFRATEVAPDTLSWRPSIHMPRWASRLTMVVTEVRVQRLQDIKGVDTIAEGIECDTCAAMRRSACQSLGCFESRNLFRDLWNSIHGAEAWAANPWVAAITFSVHRVNIDALSEVAA